MTTSAVPSYAGYRFPAEVISHAVWLYFRFPLSLRTGTSRTVTWRRVALFRVKQVTGADFRARWLR